MAIGTSSVVPGRLLRRSMTWRVSEQLGAEWAELNGGAVPMGYGRGTETELTDARRLGLAELSMLPRTGFKGAGTVNWLKGQGLEIGEPANVAYRQAGGELAIKLAMTEIFLIDSLKASGALVDRLNKAWQWAPSAPRPAQGYPTPRQDSHGWFLVTGEKAPGMFAKICGVDLRPQAFGNHRVAQTSAAKMSVVIVRDDMAGLPAYHVLSDIASGEYLWACLVDAMEEFRGEPVGLAAVRRLAGVEA